MSLNFPINEKKIETLQQVGVLDFLQNPKLVYDFH